MKLKPVTEIEPDDIVRFHSVERGRWVARDYIVIATQTRQNPPHTHVTLTMESDDKLAQVTATYISTATLETLDE